MPALGEVFGEVRKVAAVSRQRVLAGATLGRQHVEIKRDEPFAGIASRRCRATNRCAVLSVLPAMAAPSAVLEEFVGRHLHRDLALSRLHQMRQRIEAAIDGRRREPR